MKATDARKLTENSKKRQQEVFDSIFKEIEKRAQMGFFDAWVELPDLREGLYNVKLTSLGYLVKNRQGSTVLVEWG